MYKLSVGAIFKNESHSIKEWIEHYLHHGAEHFYLVNDNSDDNFIEKIQEYLDKDIITLVNGNFKYYQGRQKDMYNHHILPHLKETQWLLVVDMDEYLWSPMDVNIVNILNLCSHIGQIQVNHTLFGSNGHIEQPDSVVKGFTKRSKERKSDFPVGNRKYFINSNFEFNSLSVHNAFFQNPEYDSDSSVFMLLDEPYFVLNHYCCQSYNFWKNVKCTRGDGDHWRSRKEEEFHTYDINDVEDLDLVNQNSIPKL
jgi:glycosyltransferase involved in cell wall biosynthesis